MSTDLADAPAGTAAENSSPHWIQQIHEIGRAAASRAAAADEHDAFVAENYGDLRAAGFLAAAIPVEFGGGGVSHSTMCELLRVLAQYCSSTALAASMHQHLLAAMIWRQRHGQGGEERLRMIATKQPVLVSTGARDWLESNGAMRRTAGGYLVDARKAFASQSAAGDLLVTSAVFEEGGNRSEVLHFAVPFKTDGVTVLDDWRALGMRGTGSNTVVLKDVFVPDTAITLRRPRGAFHPSWAVVLTVAMPLIMSVYVGIAQAAAQRARAWARQQARPKPHLASALGAMHNELITAEIAWRELVRLARDLDFQPGDELAHEIVTRKTIATRACLATVEHAMDLVGGAGFYREFGLERLFRDVQAAKYHPLPEADQLQFSGEFLLRGKL